MQTDTTSEAREIPIRRARPWTALRGLRERLLHRGSTELAPSFDWIPSADVSETDRAYHVRVAVPGIDREDMHVAIEDGALVLRGARERRREEKNETLHRVEIESGAFYRSFVLPEGIDPAAIAARLENGTLEVTIPKAAPPPRAEREIAIR